MVGWNVHCTWLPWPVIAGFNVPVIAGATAATIVGAAVPAICSMGAINESDAMLNVWMHSTLELIWLGGHVIIT